MIDRATHSSIIVRESAKGHLCNGQNVGDPQEGIPLYSIVGFNPSFCTSVVDTLFISGRQKSISTFSSFSKTFFPSISFSKIEKIALDSLINSSLSSRSHSLSRRGHRDKHHKCFLNGFVSVFATEKTKNYRSTPINIDLGS